VNPRQLIGIGVVAAALLAPSDAWAQCAARPLGNLLEGPVWNGWGVDATNGRAQTAAAAGLRVEDIPRLKLKWAFGFDRATSAFAQPTLAGGRVFVGSANGAVYSLDAATGCTFWTYEAGAGVRTAMVIGANRAAPSGYAVYFGDIRANMHAVDAASGQRVWLQKVETHREARVTAAPTLVSDRLIVSVSSLEEVPGGAGAYECCTFRGSVVSLDTQSGKQIWKSFTIDQEPRPTKKNAKEVTQWGPAGAAIWSSPTVDTAKGIIYVATGNSYSEPVADTSDAVLALDLATGKRLWAKQVTPNDVYVVGCGANRTAVNCADDAGPDFDFGNSPILRTLPDGRQILVIGQKSGVAYGLDPARQGEVLWQFRVGKGSALGGMEWGSAADDEIAYFPLSDFVAAPPAEPGGLFAVRIATGELVWRTPSPRVTCPGSPRGCSPAQSAAISLIPGAVFSGAMNGYLRAYSAKDGSIIWEFNTAREFETVNGVAAKGGSINGPGPTIAGGMVFTNSGYGQFGGMPGNVLLALGVE
jgi:polyvinyl alcohol dehydrogenase (cytochrome)